MKTMWQTRALKVQDREIGNVTGCLYWHDQHRMHPCMHPRFHIWRVGNWKCYGRDSNWHGIK